MDEVAVRIFDFVKDMGMEQKEFARILGTTDKKVSAWKTGRSKTYRDQIAEIAEVLNTNTEYLLTGNGPKTRDPAGREASEVRQEFMELFSRLSPEEQAREIAYLRERVNGSGK